ncbi:DinB family protein [Deinococcus altitudinis]|uniref:DinB family protein n=1 Tax=Deinococcus altitudinis TaxID=468914 RepID=UPI003891C47B
MTQLRIDSSVEEQLADLKAVYPTPEALIEGMRQELGAFEATVRGAAPYWNTRMPGRDWTPAQEADHTIMINEGTGRLVRLLLSDKPLRDAPEEPGVTEGGRRLAPANTLPGPDQPMESVLARHAATRSLLEVHAEPGAARTFYHPFMGKIGALDWLRMAAYQTRHHRLSMQAGLDRLANAEGGEGREQ